jgi:hypothetical protein
MAEYHTDVYQQKLSRIEDAVHLKIPDRVPIILEFGYFVARYAGITYQDLVYDPVKCAAAYRKTVADFAPDAFHCIPFDSGPAMEAIDSLTVKWPGHGVGPNQSHQYVEGEFMLADEYDAFLEDPTGFLFRSYLPRICGALGSFKDFPDMLSLMGPARGIVGPKVASPEFVAACQAVYRTARKCVEWNAVWEDFVKEIELAGNPAITLVGFGQAPYDFFSDHLRGMRGIMLDMYRQPDKLLAAMDRVLPIILRKIRTMANTSGNKLVFMGPHRGSDGFMSLRQFEKFYWPGLKATILALIEMGFTPYVFWEGDYTSRLPYLLEIPPGKIICRLDRTDIYSAKKILGGHNCIAGGMLPSLLQTGSVQQVEDESAKLIEFIGKDGGFIMGSSCPLDEAKIENVKAMVETTRQYGRYGENL